MKLVSKYGKFHVFFLRMWKTKKASKNTTVTLKKECDVDVEICTRKKRLNSNIKFVTNKNPTPALPLNPHKNKQIGGIEELI